MLMPSEKEKLISDLKKADTVKQALDYINTNFKTEDCHFTILTRSQFIEGLIKSINLLNAKKR